MREPREVETILVDSEKETGPVSASVRERACKSVLSRNHTILRGLSILGSTV